jgi:hypothetical protein
LCSLWNSYTDLCDQKNPLLYLAALWFRSLYYFLIKAIHFLNA